MFSGIQKHVKKDIKNLKRKYRILKIKWFLLFILPILVIVLAYHVSRQFLKLKMQDLGTKMDLGAKTTVKDSKAEQESDLEELI